MPFVAISYRDEGRGKGAFFDHFTMRKLTQWPTQVVSDTGVVLTHFGNLINYRAGHQSYGLPIENSLPLTAENYAEEAAFLFLPGFTRESDQKQTAKHRARLKYETKLVKKALYRGQPILAVCAGSWTLWQAYGGDIIAVDDHNYGGAMPRLSKAGPRTCNNKMIHRVALLPGTFLQQSMSPQLNTEIPVNSVHWNTVDPNSTNLSTNIQVSALSSHDPVLAPKSRQGNPMVPEDSAEAFETISGVPMIGVQWHPEAFNPNDASAKPQRGIFKAMKQSGMTYLNRRELNKEFKLYWQLRQNSHASFFDRNTASTTNLNQFDGKQSEETVTSQP